MRRPEIQSTIDETADGGWEVTVFVGSNSMGCRHGRTLEEATRALHDWVDEIDGLYRSADPRMTDDELAKLAKDAVDPDGRWS